MIESTPAPTRKRRSILLFTLTVVGVSVLFAVCWFTRPTELVWSISPPIDDKSHRVRLLIPQGWEVKQPIVSRKSGAGWYASYWVFPVDRRPWIIRRLFAQRREAPTLRVVVNPPPPVTHRTFKFYSDSGIIRAGSGPIRYAQRSVIFRDLGFWANVSYGRSDIPAFNRTYRQICNSITIE